MTSIPQIKHPISDNSGQNASNIKRITGNYLIFRYWHDPTKLVTSFPQIGYPIFGVWRQNAAIIKRVAIKESEFRKLTWAHKTCDINPTNIGVNFWISADPTKFVTSIPQIVRLIANTWCQNDIQNKEITKHPIHIWELPQSHKTRDIDPTNIGVTFRIATDPTKVVTSIPQIGHPIFCVWRQNATLIKRVTTKEGEFRNLTWAHKIRDIDPTN